eukprot:scpid34071/ scgid19778/ 
MIGAGFAGAPCPILCVHCPTPPEMARAMVQSLLFLDATLHERVDIVRWQKPCARAFQVALLIQQQLHCPAEFGSARQSHPSRMLLSLNYYLLHEPNCGRTTNTSTSSTAQVKTEGRTSHSQSQQNEAETMQVTAGHAVSVCGVVSL